MCVAWHRENDFELPIILIQGMPFSCIWFMCLLVSCGFCDELAMESVPLGFEISGFDTSRTWVSQNGVFAFGFFQYFPQNGDFDGFLVGIRYNLRDKTTNLPVWAVGGGLRVSRNSTIRLSMDGRLILFENPSGLIVWSSNTFGLGIKKASLLHNGNLVLMGIGDDVLWESFSSPTSTLLPGQSLHFPQTLIPLSTKSTSSYYNFVIRSSGELALVWEDNVTYWRTRLSFSDNIIKEARFDGDGFLGLIDARNKTVWSVSSNDFKDPSVSLRHLSMDSDGNLRIYSWDYLHHEWKITWQAVGNQCDVFGSCGLYSVCRFNSTRPVCDCLYEDSLNWGNALATVDSGSFGCKKMVDLSNCAMNTSIMILKQSVLYGLYPPQDVNMLLNEENCKEYCSNDITCTAATSKNDGSGICTIKRTSFISGYMNPSIPATSFLKRCMVPQAVSAQRSNPGDVNPKTLPTLNYREDNNKKFIIAVALTVLVTVSGFLTIEMFVFWFMYHKGKIKAQTRIPFSKDAQMNAHYSVLVRLSFEEIKELTANFADQLGPTVYKGVLPNKRLVIAKKLNDSSANEKDFRVVISNLGGMHHRNLVPLKGFCFEPNHRFLLYEYIDNGSLDKWLFNMKQGQDNENWKQRIDIALGIARALAYLHLECHISVAHGNLKLENVLLDDKLIPKLTDFGLRSLLQKETASSSESPSEKDMYMFGEMLLQIVTCKRDILSENLQHFADKVNQKLDLDDRMDSEGVARVVRIALWCMQNQPFLRPSIGEVVKVLEGALSVDRPPSGFGFKQDLQIDEAVVLTEIEVAS